MVENERTKRPLASGKDRMSGKILKIEILGILPCWMSWHIQKNCGSGQKKIWLFFVPNHSIRENKVKKVDFDEKKNFLVVRFWHLAILSPKINFFDMSHHISFNTNFWVLNPNMNSISRYFQIFVTIWAFFGPFWSIWPNHWRINFFQKV